MKYKRTTKAAKTDRASRWDLIQAIGEDAADAGYPTSGLESRLAAKDALQSAGLELADSTVRDLCVTAKFYVESTGKQQQVWRRFGWSIPFTFARAGWTPEATYDKLAYEHLTQADANYMTRSRINPARRSIDEEWERWIGDMSSIMFKGAKLAAESERIKGQLGVVAAIALRTYEGLVARRLDVELRELLESEAP